MAYHSVLEQQISKFLGNSNNLPPNLRSLFEEISRTYAEPTVKLEFVSLVAHELRNPLTSLKGYAYIMDRDYQNTFDEKEKMVMQRINISIQRLAALIENLLNITRLQKDTLTINASAADWLANIDEMIQEVKGQAEVKKIDVQFIKPQDPPYVALVDKMRINEVLMNLLVNAINFTPMGGKIAVWVEKAGNEIITHVADNGPGIPKEATPNMFTKFFQVPEGEKRSSEGTGLGLYISQSIVEMHKGRIWVEAEVGKGSKFSFSVPKAT